MLDIKFIKENLDDVASMLSKRGVEVDINSLVSADSERLRFIAEVEELRAERNKIAKDHSPENIARGKAIKVAVAHGLGNACKLLDVVRKEPDRYHFIEIMGCPGGCIGGGGQPYAAANSIPLDEECLKKRAESLYDIDRDKTIRRSLDNPDIQKLYKEFLQRPLSKISHKLLHTHYQAKTPVGIIPKDQS